jgi:hypothetical protein
MRIAFFVVLAAVLISTPFRNAMAADSAAPQPTQSVVTASNGQQLLRFRDEANAFTAYADPAPSLTLISDDPTFFLVPGSAKMRLTLEKRGSIPVFILFAQFEQKYNSLDDNPNVIQLVTMKSRTLVDDIKFEQQSQVRDIGDQPGNQRGDQIKRTGVKISFYAFDVANLGPGEDVVVQMLHLNGDAQKSEIAIPRKLWDAMIEFQGKD